MDSEFNSLYLKNHFSGFTEIGIDPGLFSVPKSHLQAEQSLDYFVRLTHYLTFPFVLFISSFK